MVLAGAVQDALDRTGEPSASHSHIHIQSHLQTQPQNPKQPPLLSALDRPHESCAGRF